MPNHLCTLVESWFEEIPGEFFLTSPADAGSDLTPHFSDENGVHQCRVTAKFLEHIKILFGNPTELAVGDPMDVNDPGKPKPLFISVEELSSKD